MPGISISYRREDTSGHAGRLLDRLTQNFGLDTGSGPQTPVSYLNATAPAGVSEDGEVRFSIPTAVKAFPAAVPLPDPAEATVGGATFRILEARLERYNVEKVTLVFVVRCPASRDGYGANFWTGSMHRVVDGVARAPAAAAGPMSRGVRMRMGGSREPGAACVSASGTGRYQRDGGTRHGRQTESLH
jgi:hypothetical protein